MKGKAFEDILDGYFPLEESIRQMMARQGFVTAWITLLHAPVMNIKGLAPSDPVPFSLRKIYAGVIERMTVAARQTDLGLQLDGLGDWFWIDPRDAAPSFAPSIRLGEPAFIRGIGIEANQSGEPAGTVALVDLQGGSLLATALTAAVEELGWTSARVWGGYPAGSGMRLAAEVDEPHVLQGQEVAPGAAPSVAAVSAPAERQTYVLVDTSPNQADKEALELARLL